MRNYLIKIQYDGTNYSGWQIQNNAGSVQGNITEAAELILREKINLIGSGRTDAGVHALGQIANFRAEKEFDQRKFLHSLNSILPVDISVLEIKEVDENFHARFDAKRRSYIYIFSLIKSPFYSKYSYQYPRLKNISIETLNKIGKRLIGKNDFSSFAKNNDEIENKVCDITSLHWLLNGDLIYFYIEADRFLHGMVRSVSGTILKLAESGENADTITEILNNKDRRTAGESLPAKGLFLYKVRY